MSLDCHECEWEIIANSQASIFIRNFCLCTYSIHIVMPRLYILVDITKILKSCTFKSLSNNGNILYYDVVQLGK